MPRTKPIPEVEIVETEKAELKEPLVILGFAGAGLVGGIAVSYIIDQLGMKKIAHVRSKYMPPAVVFMDGKLRHPFRIYSDDGGKLTAVVCEVPLRSDGSYPIATTLLDWAEEENAAELVILEGAPVRGLPKKRKSFFAAEPEKRTQYEEQGVTMLSAGIIRGLAGSILNECLTRKITGVAFMVPAISFMPDPKGAAVLIETLNRIYSLDVDTEDLMERAEEIKQKLKEVAERRRRMKKAEEKRGMPESSYIA